MHRARIAGFALLLITAPVACDTDVSNPGPVGDEFLNDRNAAAAMVSGAGRALSQGMNWVGYTGAAVAREIHPAGSTGSFGISNRWQYGELGVRRQRSRYPLGAGAARPMGRRGSSAPARGRGTAARWKPANHGGVQQRAAARVSLRRLREPRARREHVRRRDRRERQAAERDVLHARREPVHEGDRCHRRHARDDREPGDRRLRRPRAGARLPRQMDGSGRRTPGRWQSSFVYNMPYYNIGDDAQRNRIAWSIGNTPYRAHTEWNTWYYDYSQASKDPRVPITITTLQGDAAIDCCGKVPFYPEAKHSTSASPIRLASGREMRLIEAEAKLRSSDVAGAMTLINTVRTNAATTAVTATTLDEGWRLLKRERGIELWLETRRLGDLRRWKAANTPGALDPLETVGSDVAPEAAGSLFPDLDVGAADESEATSLKSLERIE